MRKIIFAISFLIFTFNTIKAQNEEFSSLAQRPPMGWNSYNCFGGNVTEEEMRQNTDYVAKYMKQYGWEYIVLDFLWYCDDQDSNENSVTADLSNTLTSTDD